MKKTSLIILCLAIFTSFTACKKTQKKKTKKVEGIYKVVDSTASVKWTAYKTTEKLPVSGVFKTVNIKKSVAGQSIQSALNNLEFSIPVSSVFSNNEERDGKLKNLFFGVMQNTSLLTGKIHVAEDSIGTLDIVMNGTTNSIALTFTTQDNTVYFKGTLSLKDWHTNLAMKALNKACFNQHKGKDGISKTWDEVLVEGTIVVSK
ncbi:MAG: YceI family protein [Flavobacteriaceae bacterium]|nr:YceI family protein [Flavobacteriaceae bacterium]